MLIKCRKIWIVTYFEAKFNHTLTFITLQSDNRIFCHNELLNISLAYVFVCWDSVIFIIIMLYKQKNPSAMSSYAIKRDTCSNNISKWAYKTR